jgi:hypothetical protein
MTQQNNISRTPEDPWLAHTETAIRAYQSGDRTLRDYVPTQRPADPQSTARPGKSELPVTDPNRIHEINRTTVIVTPSGRELPNPWAVSATPVQQRPALRPIPTVEGVQQEIEALNKALTLAEGDFEADKASRPSIHARMVQISEELVRTAGRTRHRLAE